MLTVVPGPSDRDVVASAGSPVVASLIDEIVRQGVRRMLAEALRAEVGAYVAQFADQRDGAVVVWWCVTARTSLARC